ncbi:MAG: type I-C CRISPR-associated protein Cas8c/Csd1 [Hyphomonadaceae bacterium]|nr:type I-C CRISPR-associated protein Cas8c/Csd1 [Hyphomonadaceae bacterium]
MILQALSNAYERFSREKLVNGKPRVPPYGYSYERIAYALVLDEAGKLVDIESVAAGDLDVPSDPTITRAFGIKSMFLWDKTAYALGLAPQVRARTAEEHEAFKKWQRALIADSKDAGLCALLRFLDVWKSLPAELPRYRDELIGTNIVFRLDGDAGYLHDRAAAREVWLRHLQAKPAHLGPCLIKGEQARIALTHPTLGGVRGAQSSGAAIVSFNQKAFTSYGKDQGANAPVSEHGAFAYTTTLKELLRKDGPQKVQIGDATTVYWAEAADAKEAAAAERTVGYLFQPPPSVAQLDASETDRLRNEAMDLVENGRPLDSAELHLKPGTRFYILGLSPNAARLSVRFWEATTLGAIGQAFHQHWQDLHMVQPAARGPRPSVASCALMTAPARRNTSGQVKFSFDDVSPLLAGELMRAILSGGRYPGALLANLVMRIRADHHLNRLRVSLIKAVIVRTMRIDGRLATEDYLVRTDPDDPNPARRLGRLFAVLERAQLAALGENLNATIKDKYIGSAAATPAQVFTFLVKNAQHHTARLRRGHADADWIEDPKHARRVGMGLERDIARLWGSFNNGLPSQLSTTDQGLFFVGYYQERFGGKADEDAGDGPASQEPNNEE